MAETTSLVLSVEEGWILLASTGESVLLQSDKPLLIVYSETEPGADADAHSVAMADRNGYYTYSGISMGNLYVKAASENAYIIYTVG